MKKLMVLSLVMALVIPSSVFAYMQPDGVSLDKSSIVFEGATDDAFETTVSVTDPTADRTITVPDASVTLGTATAITDDTIVAADFADADWGDVSVSTNSVTLDADVVAAAEMADADHGDISWSSGVASIDAATVDTAELATDAADATILQDVVAASAANTACNTTCGIAGCYLGFDSGSNVFVDCAGATADTCACDGATS